jgi:fructosamine-3-kinase
MDLNSFWQFIENSIKSAIEEQFEIKECIPLSGGCINQSYRIGNERTHFFIKLNEISFAKNFETEALGLQEIERTQTVRVPKVITSGSYQNKSYLILEYLPIVTSPSEKGQENLGIALAHLHKKTDKLFGWKYDNVIGSTPQINTGSSSWKDFFRTNRLEFQFRLAKNNSGKTFRNSDKLLSQIDSFFEDNSPTPSLLHGDLWGGNISFIDGDIPVIFDPAPYYGDRECDIAFTEMFGGFTASFYRAYSEVWALPPGYKVRKILYNLYHILNHYNLFGSSYAIQAQETIDQLIA